MELSGGIGQDQLRHQEFVSQWRGQKLLSCSHISSDNGINKQQQGQGTAKLELIYPHYKYKVFLKRTLMF